MLNNGNPMFSSYPIATSPRIYISTFLTCRRVPAAVDMLVEDRVGFSADNDDMRFPSVAVRLSPRGRACIREPSNFLCSSKVDNRYTAPETRDHVSLQEGRIIFGDTTLLLVHLQTRSIYISTSQTALAKPSTITLCEAGKNMMFHQSKNTCCRQNM